MSVPLPKALFFDVFGTCVDWRSTVTNALVTACDKAVASTAAHDVRDKASAITRDDWGRFAQEWRNTYIAFVGSIAGDPSIPWKSVDEHHLDALKELGSSWKIDGLWSDDEILDLSLIWHRLEPWADSADGIRRLNTVLSTCTLSNGNVSLLEDLTGYGKMEFTHLFSSEHFNSYKPSPKVYLGAVERLGLSPNECMMVAAHLHDLVAARKCGLRTAYIERPLEETMDQADMERMRASGDIDIWIPEAANGFLALAAALDIGSGP
jgi:2-haloacid dehalogenase